MKLILIGIQGAGKSTQGNLLRDNLHIPYLSTGHILRAISKEKTKLGRYIKETINAGILVPDKMMIEMVEEYLGRPEYKNGYIMDGFPRTVEQAQEFSNGVDKVVYLNVSDKEALWRLSFRDAGDRQDETLVAIRKRIESFHKFTDPVIAYYREKDRLVEINGEQSIEEIYREIMNKLAS